MGAFSIFHWLIVILAFAPIAAIALVKPDKRIGKKPLLIWTAIVIALLAVSIIGTFLPTARAEVVAIMALAFLCYFVVRIFLVSRLAARLQMFGQSKWWALFCLITGIEVLFGIVLSAMSTQDEKATA